MKIKTPIEIRGIRKTYGGVTALDSIDINVEPGEFLTLLGPSGSGKSTLLMIIAGFVRPDSGSILVEGNELVTRPPHRRDIGLVFQNFALFPHMTVTENIAFPLRYRKVGKAEAGERVARAMSMVRLDGFGERSIEALSGGQKQRVALARAIVFNPTILLMDEPLSALDKKLREHMQVELAQLHRELGTTTIYVTHDQREALTMSTRIAVMNRGGIEQIGAPEDVYERPASHFVADFVGDSQFLEVLLEGGTRARLGETPIELSRPLDAAGKRALLVVRPEKLDLVPAGTMLAGMNLVPCTVSEVLYQGEQFLVSAALPGGGTVAVRRGTGHATMQALPKAGEPMLLAIHPSDSFVVAAP